MKHLIKITDSDLLNKATEVLSQYISVETISNQINTTSFLQTLVGIAVSNSSIEAFPSKFEEGVSARQMRYHLKKFGMDEMEIAINKALGHYVPPSFKRRFGSYKFAIDLHEHPYHGEPYQDATEIRRSKAKSGTTHFHTYATIYLIKNGKRYTLAMKFVRKGDSLIAVLEFLLTKILELGFNMRRLFLDRGFYSVDMINYLKKKAIPFIIPVVLRGRKGADGQSKMERYLHGNKSYSTDYTMESLKHGKKTTTTFKLYIVVRVPRGKRGQKQREYYAYCLAEDHFPLNRLYSEYRLRFGIETSYKKKNESLGKTTSRNPVIRLLYTGLSFFLVNTWIFLAWQFLSKKQRGKRQLLTARFIYNRFCELIFNALKVIFKFRPEIVCLEENTVSRAT